jgi:hypothetical protein
VLLRDNAGARSAAQQAIALDPQSPNAINSVRSRLLSAPPEASPTATPTPLSGP